MQAIGELDGYACLYRLLWEAAFDGKVEICGSMKDLWRVRIVGVPGSELTYRGIDKSLYRIETILSRTPR